MVFKASAIRRGGHYGSNIRIIIKTHTNILPVVMVFKTTKTNRKIRSVFDRLTRRAASQLPTSTSRSTPGPDVIVMYFRFRSASAVYWLSTPAMRLDERTMLATAAVDSADRQCDASRTTGTGRAASQAECCGFRYSWPALQPQFLYEIHMCSNNSDSNKAFFPFRWSANLADLCSLFLNFCRTILSSACCFFQIIFT